MTTFLTFAGQSNMTGFRSWLDFLPSYYVAHTPDYYLRDGTLTDFGPFLRDDPNNTNGFRESNFVPDGQASYGYGVEIFLSLLFSSKDQKITTVRTAQGNTSLDYHWNAAEEGFYWSLLEQNLGHALADVPEGASPEIGPMIWWQGENDSSNVSRANSYEENLRQFIAEYRTTVGQADAPFVIVLTVTGGYPDYRSIVQDAQRTIAAEDPNVLLYDPSHLPRYSDGVHFHRDYAIEAATDLADMIIDAGWMTTPHQWGTRNPDDILGDQRNQTLWGLQGDDTLRGEAGNDILAGDLGADVLDGGSGFDVAVYNASTGAVNIDLATGDASGGSANGDTLVSIEGIEGTAYSDRLTGDAANNYLNGGGERDYIAGGDGDDTVIYDAADRLWGTSITGGRGVDTLQLETGAVIRTSNLLHYGFERFVGADMDDAVQVRVILR